jgi:hypothetical protein
MTAWQHLDGTISWGLTPRGDIVELRHHSNTDWEIVAHVDFRDGGAMIETSWRYDNPQDALDDYHQYLGIRRQRRRPNPAHPAGSDE